MLRMIESEFKGDFFDRERGRCKENFGLQDNMVHDGFLGGKTGILFYQEIQVIGMRMETVGVKAHRTLVAIIFLDQFIKFFYERVVDLFFLLALRLRKQPIAFNNQFKDFDGNHEAFLSQFPLVLTENIFEKWLQLFDLVVF